MKELKKLKKLLGKKAVNYIKFHEGMNNKRQRDALNEIQQIRMSIGVIEASDAGTQFSGLIKAIKLVLGEDYKDKSEKLPETKGRFVILRGGIDLLCNVVCDTCHNQDLTDEINAIFKPLCEPNDYKKNKHKLKEIEHIDKSHISQLLRCGGSISSSIDALTQLKKIRKGKDVGITELINLMNELRTVSFILEK